MSMLLCFDFDDYYSSAKYGEHPLYSVLLNSDADEYTLPPKRKFRCRGSGESENGSGHYFCAYRSQSFGPVGPNEISHAVYGEASWVSDVVVNDYLSNVAGLAGADLPATDPEVLNRGLNVQAVLRIRQGYLVCVWCGSWNWYPYRLSVAVYPLRGYRVKYYTNNWYNVTIKSGFTSGWKAYHAISGYTDPVQALSYMHTLAETMPVDELKRMCPSRVAAKPVGIAPQYNRELPATDPALTGPGVQLMQSVRNCALPTQFYELSSYAYNAALEQIPVSSVNPLTVLSDVGSLASTIKGVAQNIVSFLTATKLKKGAKDLSSAYLGNKYGIQTMLSDTESVIETYKRIARLQNRGMICHGSRSGAVFYGGQICQARVSVSLRYSSSQALDMTQLSHSFLTLKKRAAVFVWDVIPFSFVLDWFYDFEGLLTYLGNLSVDMTWAPSDCWVSVVLTDPDGNQSYARYRGSQALMLTDLGRLSFQKDSSGKTMWYHIMDGLALTVGFL